MADTRLRNVLTSQNACSKACLQRPRWLIPGAQGYGITLGTINFLGVLAAMFQAMPSLQFQARPHPAQTLLLPCSVHAQPSIPDAPALCLDPVRATFQAMPSLQVQARPHLARTPFGLCSRACLVMHISLSGCAGACFRESNAIALRPSRAAWLLFFSTQTLKVRRARMIWNLKHIILALRRERMQNMTLVARACPPVHVVVLY